MNKYNGTPATGMHDCHVSYAMIKNTVMRIVIMYCAKITTDDYHKDRRKRSG